MWCNRCRPNPEGCYATNAVNKCLCGCHIAEQIVKGCCPNRERSDEATKLQIKLVMQVLTAHDAEVARQARLDELSNLAVWMEKRIAELQKQGEK